MIFVDCEGEPIQEFTALYVDSALHTIVDVFHRHVAFPSSSPAYDSDQWGRRHIHGLNRDYLATHGLKDETNLMSDFYEWLRLHPYDTIFANAPHKESTFLNLPIVDVCLPSWKERVQLLSHYLTLKMKRRAIPINGIKCDSAHSSYKNWSPRRPYNLSPTDVIKLDFGFHCSLYDCFEIFWYYLK